MFKVGRIAKVLILGALLFSSVQAVAAISGEEKFKKYEYIVSGFQCNIAAETIGKTYFYLNAGIGGSTAKVEQYKATVKFEKNFKHLDESIDSKKIKNLLRFIKLDYDKLLGMLEKKYSLDNARKVLSLVDSVSEGSRHIAEVYKKEIGHNDPVNRSGLQPVIESIAKYYMAYQLGIKDEDTVKKMKQAVKFSDNLIQVRVNYPKNTAEMNRVSGEILELWAIVNDFFLNIDDGGLPYIVFKTTKELREGIQAYAKLYKAELKKGSS